MPKYRHYRLDGAGNISGADWLEAGDDEDAVRQVRDRKLPVPSEVWSGDRLVGRVDPASSGV